MKNIMRADGRARGKGEPMSIATVAVLRPALVDIPSACQYLGDPSRAKFYADLLPDLDVVKLGARTFVTLDSLDRLIIANKRPAAKQSGETPSGTAGLHQ